MNVLNWVLTGFLTLGFVSGFVFMVIYTKRWDWWDDEHGAHLGFFTLSLTLIMGLYLLRPFIEPVLFSYLRAPFFVAVILCMVWRLILLIKSGHASTPGMRAINRVEEDDTSSHE